ncbi:MAG: CYTH domain-containing protein [Bacteroidales bacterium]|nr:CYTH domain-containing protein [Bacteroidales bacterium]
MPTEIERKYLVKNLDFLKELKPKRIIQGYIAKSLKASLRIRIIEDKGFITIKGNRKGISRPEYEYEIPYYHAKELLENFAGDSVIEKDRYKITFAGRVFEVDVFYRENEGLVIAEVELDSEKDKIELPEWIGREVSRDTRYYNSHLIKNPYCNW